jgi:predicted transcriptional regulator
MTFNVFYAWVGQMMQCEEHCTLRSLVYADGLNLEHAAVGIGLSCRLCDRPNCRSRAFPPLEHRPAVDPNLAGDSPYRFEAKRG